MQRAGEVQSDSTRRIMNRCMHVIYGATDDYLVDSKVTFDVPDQPVCWSGRSWAVILRFQEHYRTRRWLFIFLLCQRLWEYSFELIVDFTGAHKAGGRQGGHAPHLMNFRNYKILSITDWSKMLILVRIVRGCRWSCALCCYSNLST